MLTWQSAFCKWNYIGIVEFIASFSRSQLKTKAILILNEECWLIHSLIDSSFAAFFVLQKQKMHRGFFCDVCKGKEKKLIPLSRSKVRMSFYNWKELNKFITPLTANSKGLAGGVFKVEKWPRELATQLKKFKSFLSS